MYQGTREAIIHENLGGTLNFRVDFTPIRAVSERTPDISTNNTVGGIKLPKIVGDYTPGYIYGNPKTHKPGYPLRPIISQIPTPTYSLAKRLNSLLTPYIPSEFSLRATTDFVDVVRRSRPCRSVASMDVEALFTNVPVGETTQIILDTVYRGNSTPLDIPEECLRRLLIACTSESPFYGPHGDLFVQRDGVAMGSPLGVLYANMYMGTVEERVFSDIPRPLPIAGTLTTSSLRSRTLVILTV